MTRVTWSVPRGTFVGDRLDVSSLVGDDVRTTRATADEIRRRFHRQATATIERLRRAFESSNHRLAFASIRCFRFAPSPNRMNDRPTDHSRRKRGAPSRVSILDRPRRPRRPDVDVDADVGSRRRPHRTERDASTRSRSNRPFESSRIVLGTTPPFLIVVLGLFFFFSRVCDAHRTR